MSELREARSVPGIRNVAGNLGGEFRAVVASGLFEAGLLAREGTVTPKTVEAHVRSIFRKLDLPMDAMENRRVHAVLTFMRARSV